MSFIDDLMELGVREKVDRLYLEKCQEVNRLERKLDGQKALLGERNKEITALRDELRKLKEAQDGDLISRTEALKEIQEAFAGFVIYPVNMQNYDVDYIKRQYKAQLRSALERIKAIPAVSGLSAAERLHDEVEELWQDEHMKGLAAEAIADMGKSAKKVGETIKELLCEFKETAETVELQEGYLEQKVTAQEILCLSSALRNLYEIHKCDGWLLYTRLSKVLERAVDEYSRELGDTE